MIATTFALFVGATASSCTAADMTIWKNSVQANFQADEKKCALRCAGQNPCTGDCMSSEHGFSHDCGQCFGDLSSCVVAHCVVAPGNCGISPNGEACKTCTDQHCTPAFNSCTGFDIPSKTTETLEAGLQCTAADTKIWKDSVEANFQADEKTCALQCGGQNPCTGDCMSRKHGFSHNCGQCFGDLSSCVVSHCLGSGNCAIAPNGQACKSCTDQHCTPAFNTCTGFGVPSNTVDATAFIQLESGLQCTAADTKIWKDSVEANFQADEKTCALQCGGQNPCTGDCMSRKHGFSHNCGQCFGDLSSCVVSHCLGSGNCAIAPNGQACKSCTDQHCTPAFNTCTGFGVPSNTVDATAFIQLESGLQCTAADTKIWKDSVQANFQADEKKCALRCAGQNPCTGNCMSSEHGFSHNCGQCFGDLSSCVVAHCVVAPGNCGISPNGQACKSCTDQHCTPAFNTCTGFDVSTTQTRLDKLESKTLVVA